MTHNPSPINLVLSKLPDAIRSGDGWKACCPAHDDRNPSLSIREADNGNALLKCQSQHCEPQAICDEMGIKLSDLFVSKNSTPSASAQPSQPGGKTGFRRSTNGKPSAKTFNTANEAIQALSAKRGKPSLLSTYRDASGEPVGVVVRWDDDKGKTIRPVSKRGSGWTHEGMASPRPLYGLPELIDAECVYLVEGEKCCEAARPLGLTVTTSAQGSNGVHQTDWTPLAGKDVVILPDNDEPGKKYAQAVAGILAALTPPARVKIVQLPNLGEKEDFADWVQAQPNTQPEELRRQVEAMADECPVEEVAADDSEPEPGKQVADFVQFPTETLPQPFRRFVEEEAKAIGCDTSFLALPLLSVLAAAIGKSRIVQVTEGWTEPSIIWAIIVGKTGTSKTPAFNQVMKPLRAKQSKAFKDHHHIKEEYDQALATYNRDSKEWASGNSKSILSPVKPEEVHPDLFHFSDVTIEALAEQLTINDHGILGFYDELRAFFQSFGRYNGGKGGAELSNWLEMFNGNAFNIIRKSTGKKLIHVSESAVSLTGGIQPAMLAKEFDPETFATGMAARFLLAYPPTRVPRLTNAIFNRPKVVDISIFIDRLYELERGEDEEGNATPKTVRLCRDACEKFMRFWNPIADRIPNASENEAAVLNKFKGYTLRLALVIHCCRQVTEDSRPADPLMLDGESMDAAIRLAEWFIKEAERVYQVLSETTEENEQRELVEWISQRGGKVTPRDLYQNHRRFKGKQKQAQLAKEALNNLVDFNFGTWQQAGTDQPGRNSQVFALSTVYTLSQSAQNNAHSVDSRQCRQPENASDGEWGEL